MPTLALPAVVFLLGGGEAAMLRLIVCSIYTVGFWTVAGIVAVKTGTFPLEMFLAYSAGLGTIVAALKDRDEKNDKPAPEEKP